MTSQTGSSHPVGKLLSMTGFGAATLEEEARRITVETRSVNHRYLKLHLKVPRALSGIEAELEASIKKQVQRGVISVNVQWTEEQTATPYLIDEAVLMDYLAQLKSLETQHSLNVPSEAELLSRILTMPGTVVAQPRDQEDDTLQQTRKDLAHRATSAAMKNLIESRSNEGHSLGEILLQHANALESNLEVVIERAPSVPTQQRDRMHQRVRGLLKDLDPKVPVSESDLLRELCLLADRTDVTEEIRRLETHLARYREIIAKGGEVGRKLDFLIQEMLREVNTIGSKASDTTLAHAVVEMKVEVERMKEQVQNLE